MKLSHHSYILVVLFCQICGLVLFLRGFFPVKKGFVGEASVSELPSEPGEQEKGSPMKAKFQRLVVMLVDALRADFVFSTEDDKRSNKFGKMKYVWQLVNSSNTLSFYAKAHPPTVTMPRIKAITTGSIPGFIDIVLNLDSKELQEDNLLTQLNRAGKKIVFYGDDTWIKLFPNHFVRTDGTTSFFVTDYTEVDNNVTRHISSEMDKDDWHTMILHYLGLDHIGHTAGPSSPLVQPKLQEMDQIVEEVHKALLRWDQENRAHSLLVLCGDHGMSDSGSHGGASAAETLTPLVFLSSMFSSNKGTPFTEQVVDQIDLAPTLALLFGLPIPQNSIGNIIPEVLKFHKPRERLRALQLNAHQLSKVLLANGHSTTNIWELQQAYKLHADWLEKCNNQGKTGADLTVQADLVAKQYIVASKKMKKLVTASLSNYDLHAMVVGVVLIWESLFGGLYGLLQLLGKKTEECSIPMVEIAIPTSSLGLVSGATFILIAVHIGLCSSVVVGGSESLCKFSGTSLFFATIFILFTGITIAVFLSIATEKLVFQNFKVLPLSSLICASFLFGLGTILHTFSLLSSSFVEEEHQTWYFLTVSYFIISFSDTIGKLKGDQAHEREPLAQNSDLKKELTDNQEANEIGNSFSDGNKENDCKEHLNSNFTQLRKKNYSSHSDPGPIPKITNKHLASTLRGYFLRTHRNEPQATTDLGVHSFDAMIHFAVSTVLVACIRLSRSLNQTGIKWAHRTDIGDWLVKPENKIPLSSSVAVSLLLLTVITFMRRRSYEKFNFLVFFVGVLNVYSYRAVSGSVWLPWLQDKQITKGISEARFVYFCVVSLLLKNLFAFRRVVKLQKEDEVENWSLYRDMVTQCLEGIRDSLLLLMAVLLRPHNIILLVIFVIAENCVTKYIWNQNDSTCWTVPIAALWLGKSAFFTQGNSNSLATIDISAGYVGLEEYIPFIVGPLTFLSTYCGPLLWYTSAVMYIVSHSSDIQRLKQSLVQLCYVFVLHESFILAVYSVLVFGQRYHLFVWSVFSPKLLYEAATTFFIAMCVAVTLVMARTLGWTSK